MKSDQGLAIVDVLKEIAKLRSSQRTMLEASPVGDSKSNGVAERAIQSMWKLIGVHELSIETRVNEKLSVRHPLFAWFVEVCADSYNRVQIGFDGKTAYRRTRAR